MSLDRIASRENLVASAALPRCLVVHFRVALEVVVARERRRAVWTAERSVGECVFAGVRSEGMKTIEHLGAFGDGTGIDCCTDIGGMWVEWCRPDGYPCKDTEHLDETCEFLERVVVLGPRLREGCDGEKENVMQLAVDGGDEVEIGWLRWIGRVSGEGIYDCLYGLGYLSENIGVYSGSFMHFLVFSSLSLACVELDSSGVGVVKRGEECFAFGQQ